MNENIAEEKNQPMIRRVLLAEDDKITQKLLARLIDREGYQAVTANDGREALRLLRQDADFAGAIFDVQMPHLNGLEVLQFMQTENRLKRIPVMMITSASDINFHVESLANGSLFFIHKPIVPLNFQNLLRILVAKGTAEAAPTVTNK